MTRTEIHFHLLPGLDDGPATIEESVELARAAAADGTSTIVATPHVRADFVTEVTQLPGLVREVQERIDREGIGIAVRTGAELGHDMVGRLDQRELDTIAVGPEHRRWLLLEAPFEGIAEPLHAAADELRARGFGVVLAHPERSAGLLAGGSPGLRRELARGSLLQVNGGSLLGAHGPAARVASLRLVRSGLAAAVASDAHSLARGRRPLLTRACETMLAEGVDPGRARHLTTRGPERLVRRGVLAPGRVPVAA
ncbi:MAG: hypothetical protein IRZ21_02480 [Thermoleophilaceae bacterium]|nr:hypothetical protein [Thermoleophilaceae bacterium]